ncbi:MAG TPA: hypothetical protein VM600_02985, partial [Actinomycetota bacterium]|nr:hypothetical protein [Actinomycetota bacterium]
MNKRLVVGIAFVMLATLFTGGAPSAGAVTPGTNVLYTSDADFDQGVLADVNHDAPNSDQLQLSKSTTFFPFVNIALSGRDSMARIDVNTGAVVGEYRTAPSGMAGNPSRTTVDRLGNVWVANRNESSGGRGSITRVGVLTGGTRAAADGTPDPTGGYFKGPFAYNTCVDRNNDSLIRTSMGLFDALPWTNAGAVDSDGGVDTAEDECIINYTRVAGTLTRTVAVDANNDVWVGGFGNLVHEKLDGITGEPVAGTQIDFDCGGYGGLIDQNGILWSARGGRGLLRYDPATDVGVCLSGRGDYGLGLDPNTNEVWHTNVSISRVNQLDQLGGLLNFYGHGNTFAQGVAVDKVGNVWVAHSILGPQTTVGHLRTDGTYVGNINLPGGAGPTGVAVDANGKVWVANLNTNNAMRIDPNAGPIGGGGIPVGAVDLVVDLGQGSS